MVQQIESLQQIVGQQAIEAVQEVRNEIRAGMASVFPGYTVDLTTSPGTSVDERLGLSARIVMGPENGFKTDIHRQGSGACRTLLWSALRILGEKGIGAKKATKKAPAERFHVLLMDEPELCLHPNAVRESCKALYDLPARGNWQVMITTHSPVFIDFSRDNTSIVRVERVDGVVNGTTIYRPRKAALSPDDRERLMLLNMCDPHVAEFFFGGRTIFVEGDTEFTLFRHLAAKHPELFHGIHVVRARGKATIVSLCKILNQFDKPYAVLHDTDLQLRKDGHANGTWSVNNSIREVIGDRLTRGDVRLVASLHTFEKAFFNELQKDDKPYNAMATILRDPAAMATVKSLLECLIDHTKAPPAGAVAWTDIQELELAMAGQN